MGRTRGTGGSNDGRIRQYQGPVSRSALKVTQLLALTARVCAKAYASWRFYETGPTGRSRAVPGTYHGRTSAVSGSY